MMQKESWNCKKCKKSIDGHNYYCHDGMCDDCFNKIYFPEDQEAYEKRIIKIGSKIIDPIGLTVEEFGKELGLTKYIEAECRAEDNVNSFFLFLEKIGNPKIIAYNLYDGEINHVFELSFEEIKNNLQLEQEDKGVFFDEDDCVSPAFTDGKNFFAIILRGIIFFTGSIESTELMKEILRGQNINFHNHKAF